MHQKSPANHERGYVFLLLKGSLEPHLTLRQRLSPVQEKDALEQFSKR